MILQLLHIPNRWRFTEVKYYQNQLVYNHRPPALALLDIKYTELLYKYKTMLLILKFNIMPYEDIFISSKIH